MIPADWLVLALAAMFGAGCVGVGLWLGWAIWAPRHDDYGTMLDALGHVGGPGWQRERR